MLMCTRPEISSFSIQIEIDAYSSKLEKNTLVNGMVKALFLMKAFSQMLKKCVFLEVIRTKIIIHGENW